MTKYFLILTMLIAGLQSQAQFGGLGNKLKNAAKNKAEDRAVDKTTQSVDNGIDNIFGKKKKKSDQPSTGSEATEANSNEDDQAVKKGATVSAYSKFDFIPGERTLYAEDFGQDAIGELPLSFNTTGKGEVMTLEGKEGKWLRGYQNNTVLTGNTSKLGENYTIEFDAIFYFTGEASYSFPDFEFGIISTGDGNTTDNSVFSSLRSKNAVEVSLQPYHVTKAQVESHRLGKQHFKSDFVKVEGYTESFNTVYHYSIQVQKTRFRFWLNDKKLFDIPRGVSTDEQMNQLFFRLTGSNYSDEQIGYYLTNIKVATGLADTRHKLIEEGKFSTTGILFSVNSAVIKPESYAVVKEIATVLKDNPSIQIHIIGHTSSDGNAKANLELSKQRAAAVKDLLVRQFDIAGDRLKTDGKGDKEPTADNKTQEGRIQNRRVEFIKQ